MSVNERVKEVRKTKSLTLEAFGAKIGVTKTTISRIERGDRGLTDQMCRSICREFGVSENWLRTGEGTMFETSNAYLELEEIINRRLRTMPEQFRRRLTVALSNLSESDWEVFSRFVSDLVGEMPEEAIPKEETWGGKNREELHAELDRRLDEEKARALSQYSEEPLNMTDAG